MKKISNLSFAAALIALTSGKCDIFRGEEEHLSTNYTLSEQGKISAFRYHNANNGSGGDPVWKRSLSLQNITQADMLATNWTVKIHGEEEGDEIEKAFAEAFAHNAAETINSVATIVGTKKSKKTATTEETAPQPTEV